MDYNNYNRGYAEPAMTSADYMSRTYRWMACGLLVTFAAAFVTAATPLFYVVNSLYLLFTIAEFALVFVLSSRVQNMSVGGARAALYFTLNLRLAAFVLLVLLLAVVVVMTCRFIRLNKAAGILMLSYIALYLHKMRQYLYREHCKAYESVAAADCNTVR